MRHPDIDRRSFLRGAGLTLAGFGVTSLFPTPLIRHAMAMTGNENKRILFIFMRGGNDAVNAFIPHGDPEYNATNRPTLYIPPADAIDLNGFASFHPALGDLMDLYDLGRLAVVHRVGYPNMTRSHFDGQRVWENGDPARPFLFDGWLYRYIREHADARMGTFPAVGSPFAGTLVTGEQTYKIDITNPDDFDYGAFAGQPNRDKFRDGWRQAFSGLSRDGAYRQILSETEVKLQDAIDEYASWDQANWHPTHPNTGDFLFPVDDATNPPDPSSPTGLRFDSAFYAFFKNLKVCALSLLESVGSSNGTRVAGAQLDGFDTHEGQGQMEGAQASLLEALAYGMNSLYIALSGQATNEPRGYPSIWNDLVMLTMSEFGRTSHENGSFGTDHGNAAGVLVAGGGVNGGVYNCDSSNWFPGDIFSNEGRDLVHVTDYRALYWEILRDHMGADPATVDTIFPGYSSLGLTEPGVVGP